MSDVAAAPAVAIDSTPGTTPSATPTPINVSTGSPGSSSSSGAQSASTSDWTSGLNDDVKGYVQNKGFKDPAAVLDSYRNLEKLVGAPRERLLQIPDKADAPEWNEVYNKLGRPATAKDYKVDSPDKDFAKWAQDTFHGLGLTKAQGETLAAKFGEIQNQSVEKMRQANNARVTQETDGLKKEWGAAYEQNLGVAKRAAKEFSMDGPTIDKLENALGFAGVMKLFQNIGSKLGEDKFVAADGRINSFGALTPEAARNRINSLRNDSDFVRRYTSGDVSAMSEMTKLHEWAYQQ